ncbi:MAG: YihY family inner membrane protein [Verrucomicrobiales bacterium]|nr:YihY family inner membrane protein [Verrucomicrobiales bacterium]
MRRPRPIEWLRIARTALQEESLLGRPCAAWSRTERFFHFWGLVGRSFSLNRGSLRAAALAYTSLLAIVPLFAVIISISGSLLKRQGEQPVMELIDRVVEGITPGLSTNLTISLFPHTPVQGTNDLPATAEAGGPETVTPGGDALATGASESPAASDRITLSRQDIKDQIRGYIENIRTEALGVGGLIALLVLALGLIHRVEETFNDIWSVHRGRTWHGRIAYYTAALVLGPVLLAAAVTLTSTDYVQSARQFVREALPGGVWLERSLLKLTPYVLVSLAFTLIYTVMPNTRVKWWAALGGGVLAGCLWQLNSELGVFYVSRVVTYSRIYGGIGLVLLFMLGLYLSWIILLLGAQVAFALQHHRRHIEDRQAETMSQRGRERVAVEVMALVGRAFLDSTGAPTIGLLARAAKAPVQLVSEVIASLSAARLVNQVQETDPAYVPARPPGRITVCDVLEALRNAGGKESVESAGEGVSAGVSAEYARLARDEQGVSRSVTIEDLVGKLNGQPDQAALALAEDGA